MFKTEMQKLLSSQLEDKDLCVKTLVMQSLVWPEFEECRLFLADGDVYSCLFFEGEKNTEFVLCPKEGK